MHLNTLGTRGFSRVRREFSVLAEGRSRAGYYEDLTETGNRARKVSGTQGSMLRKRLLKVLLPCICTYSSVSFKIACIF